MAVTSVDLPKSLLSEARTVFNAKSNREAIQLALEDAIRRHHQREAVRGIAALDLDWDAKKVDVDLPD